MDQRTYQRPILYLAMAVIGFVAGALVFSKPAAVPNLQTPLPNQGGLRSSWGADTDPVLSAIEPAGAAR